MSPFVNRARSAWRLPWAALWLMVGCWLPAGAWAGEWRVPANCEVPEDLTYSDVTLPRLADRITSSKVSTRRSGGPTGPGIPSGGEKGPPNLTGQPNPSTANPADITTVTVVVLGSGSSAGVGVSAPELAYPRRLAADLGHIFPGLRFDVRVLAKRGAQVADMLGRLQGEVMPLHPTLLIWQIGASDAVEGVPINRFGRELQRGLEAAQRAGVDVMLMDMQYSPFTEMLINAREYRGYIRWIAKRQQVPLLRRYEMMEYWEEQHVFDLDNTDPAVRARTADGIHACVSARTAQLIKVAVAAARSR